MKKIISLLLTAIMAISTTSAVYAEAPLSYTNQFEAASDAWTNSNAARGTVTVDEKNGWLIINNQAASEQAGSFEGYYSTSMDFTDKYIQVNTRVRFDDFLNTKGFTFRASSTLLWASTNTSGVLSFMGTNTGTTLTTGTWYDFELKMDVTGDKASLTVKDSLTGMYKYNSGITTMPEDFRSFAATTRLGAIVFQHSQKTSDVILTIDSYSLSEITEAEMYLEETVPIISEDFSTGIWTNTAPARGSVTHNAEAGEMVITNKQIGVENYPDAGSINADYFLASAVSVDSAVIEIKSRVKFDDFNTDKGLELRIHESSSEDLAQKNTHQYASIASNTGELIFMGTRTGILLTANAWYNFTFTMNTSIGYGSLLVKDIDGAVIYNSAGKTLNWVTSEAKAYNNMLSISRIGFIVFASEMCDSTMTVDSCSARMITDENEINAIELSTIHASTPIIKLDDALTTITATITTQAFMDENAGKNYTGYFALYNKNGVLLGVEAMSATTATIEATVTETMALSDEAAVIKTYLWDADRAMIPVLKSEVYEVTRPVQE